MWEHNMEISIKRALISCYDKEGLVPLVETLSKFNCELISTGGTKKLIEDLGLPVTDISDVTKQPEAFGGRVKTLSYQISASLLFDRDKDKQEAKTLGVEPIDLVVCNFYPFEDHKEAWKKGEDFVEWIDIGGPTMVRSAAKNFKHVGVLASPKDYALVIEELQSTQGKMTYNTRKNLMAKAFNYVASYDAAIAMSVDAWRESPSQRFYFPNGKAMRYGENSHQKSDFYLEEGSFYNYKVHQGKELSYNNILDMQAAFDSIRDFKEQACSVIKHNTPCGIATGENSRLVLQRAWEGDSTSAFGSIIIMNRKCELETVQFFNLESPQKKFVEVLIAPEFSLEAQDYLSQHKNLRVVTYDPHYKEDDLEYRFVEGGLLVQDKDRELYSELSWVSRYVPKELSEDLIVFGLQSIRPMKSNAIAIVRKNCDGTMQVLGMGCGQPNRVSSVKLAVEKATENLRNEFTGHGKEAESYVRFHLEHSVLLSEAFFPFVDNIDVCHRHGIRTIVQPGGALRDKELIDACDRLGIAMLFTRRRHFKH